MTLSNLKCTLLLVVFSFYITDGYYFHLTFECRFSRKDLRDAELVRRRIFNKVEVLRFNSTLKKYIGYTETGVYNAEKWNNDPAVIARIQGDLDSVCKHNAAIFYSNVLEKTAEPYIKLKSAKPASSKHPAMLVCSAFGFYPKAIRVTWLRDGEEVTSDVTSTEELSDGDWYYQVHSHLEYTPKSGETISCKVEHASFTQPKVVNWDPSMPESERNKFAIGASGLVLGVIIAAAGLIYYKKNPMGRQPKGSHKNRYRDTPSNPLTGQESSEDDEVLVQPGVRDTVTEIHSVVCCKQEGFWCHKVKRFC